MSRPRTITAIDIGTDKCVTLIASVDLETSILQVKGVSAVPARGVRKSLIVDLEQVVQTMTESLEAAERMAGIDATSAYLNVSGTHIASKNSKGVVAVAAPNHEISASDITRVIEAARAISLPSEREVIHTIARDFTVDSQTGIKDPVGMNGIRLEAEAHMVTGLSTPLRNLEKCIHDLGLSLDGFVFSGLASAYATLSETEKELGVAVVDIGAGSTAVSVFVEGVLEHSFCLPLGARHITQDLALGCRISLDHAEKIKLSLATDESTLLKPISGESKEEFQRRKKKIDILDLEALGINDQSEPLSRSGLINGIIVPRLKEIFTQLGKELQIQQLLEKIPAGIVITGGGAQTIMSTQVAKRTLNLPARLGIPTTLKGLVNDIRTPAFSASIGLLLYGHQAGGGGIVESNFSFKSITPANLWQGLKSIFKAFLP